MPYTISPDDETYILNSETSNYDKNTVLLNIKLPSEDPSNTYQFTIYDISQQTNGQLYNGLFVFMKKTNDNGDDLGAGNETKVDYTYSFDISEKIQLNGQPGYIQFDSNDATMQSFVIVYHYNSEDADEKLSCAIHAFDNVPALFDSIIANGNCHETMELVVSKPRRIGMSRIRPK